MILLISVLQSVHIDTKSAFYIKQTSAQFVEVLFINNNTAFDGSKGATTSK